MTLKNIKPPLSTIKARLFLSSALLLTATCQANEFNSSFYAGVGLSTISIEDSGASSKEIGATLMGGYEYSPYFSAEISLFNLNEHEALGMKGNGVTLSVLGRYLVLDRLSLFAELGIMSVNIAIDELQNVAQNYSDEESLQDGIDSSLYFGMGAQYKLTDWTLVLKVTATDLDADMNIISAQAHYHF